MYLLIYIRGRFFDRSPIRRHYLLTELRSISTFG